MNGTDLKAFSEHKHHQGEWKTSVVPAKNIFIRTLGSFLSLKRRGVTRLAGRLPTGALVLDIGCGTGAYSAWIGSQKSLRVVAMDWSFESLFRKFGADTTTVMRVCADASRMPFREHSFSGAFSIDTLGHVRSHDQVLDELVRVTRPNAPCFLHSECNDYQQRWPDREIIRRLGDDKLAQQDGHINLVPAFTHRSQYARRFRIRWFASPGGVFGWLLGYPEKYAPVMRQAGMTLPWVLCSIFAVVKRLPVVGGLLRLLNASTNRLEIFLGIHGGGSCFAEIQRVSESSSAPSSL